MRISTNYAVQRPVSFSGDNENKRLMGARNKLNSFSYNQVPFTYSEDAYKSWKVAALDLKKASMSFNYDNNRTTEDDQKSLLTSLMVEKSIDNMNLKIEGTFKAASVETKSSLALAELHNILDQSKDALQKARLGYDSDHSDADVDGHDEDSSVIAPEVEDYTKKPVVREDNVKLKQKKDIFALQKSAGVLVQEYGDVDFSQNFKALAIYKINKEDYSGAEDAYKQAIANKVEVILKPDLINSDPLSVISSTAEMLDKLAEVQLKQQKTEEAKETYKKSLDLKLGVLDISKKQIASNIEGLNEKEAPANKVLCSSAVDGVVKTASALQDLYLDELGNEASDIAKIEINKLQEEKQKAELIKKYINK